MRDDDATGHPTSDAPAPAPAPAPAGDPRDRRHRLGLRELLDELLSLARDLSHRAGEMSRPELEYAHQRLEWLADEVWREAIRDEPPR
jgi:hypothetical protein